MTSKEFTLRKLLIAVAVTTFALFLVGLLLPLWSDGRASWIWPVAWLVVVAVAIDLGYFLYTLVRRSIDYQNETEIEAEYVRGDPNGEFEERRKRLRGES